jgi:hypothetical protein
MPKRTLALIDIENLYGDCSPTSPRGPINWSHGAIAKGLVESLYDCPNTPAVLACSHAVAKSVAFGWPSAGLRQRSGQDGADLALLAEYTPEEIAERFTRVILASGDGIFANFASDLGALGVRVDVLSRPESLSKRLRLAARNVYVFDSAVFVGDANLAYPEHYVVGFDHYSPITAELDVA